MNYKTTIPMQLLLLPLFTLFFQVIFVLTLQLSALLAMSLSLGLSFTLPTIAVAIGITLLLTAQLTLALELNLPSFNIDLSLAFSFELTLVLAALLQLEILLAINATLCAYGWFGSASSLGPAVTSTVGEAWPDGTDAEAPITAILLVAVAGSSSRPDEVEDLSLLVDVNPPQPPPANPPLDPDTPYPPPQAYTAGLASVIISPPTEGSAATGTVTVDISGSGDTPVGIGAITGIELTSSGSGYTSPPTIQIVDATKIVSASGNVLTLPRPLSVPIGEGFAVSVADTAVPPNIVTGVAKVLTATTVELYSDSGMLIPLAGDFTDATVSGAGVGAAALAVMGGGSQQGIKTLLNGLRWPNVSGVLDGGVITLQDCMPGVFSTLAALKLNLTARASLLGSVSAGVSLLPPSVAASIDFVAKIAANLTANIDVELPSLGASFAASIDLQLKAVGDLVANIGLYLGLAELELEIWEYTGPGSGLGAAIASGPGASGWHGGTPASTPVVVGVFGLTTPASVVAFKALFPGAA